MTRTVEQIDKEIAEIKAQLNDVHGTETEVYARIVGYYRAVKNWNKGKADEFKTRKMFTLEASSIPVYSEEVPAKMPEVKVEANAESSVSLSGISSYEFFGRATCPNCPKVKEYMATVKLPGTYIDVDTEKGFDEATQKGVISAPTVILYNAEGKELSRGHTVNELKEVLEGVTA